MFNSKSNVADLEGTLLQLDSLHTSYAALLKSAEDQLANLSLQDTDYKRMLTLAVGNSPLRTKLNEETSASVLRAIKNDSDNSILDAIVTKVSKQILTELNVQFISGLPAIYQEVIDSDMFAKAVDTKLAEHKGLYEALNISEVLKVLIQKVNTANEPEQGTTK